MQRRWEDAVVIALVACTALVAGALISATSVYAAEVSYKQSFEVVTSDTLVPTQPTALVLVPDGTRAYVANRLDHSLAQFGIDAAGNWQKRIVYAESPTNGLAAPVQLVLSHDQSHLYVLGDPNGNADTLAEFAIDAATGNLAFKKLHTNGAGDLSGLVAPAGIAVSPDDAHVYVTSSGDHRVLVFARQSDGTLTFVNSVQDGTGGVDGLNGADQIAISADGKSVYISSGVEHSIATFRRESSTGALSFLNVLVDGVSGVDGLLGAHAIALSDDGAHVYVGGLGDNAIAVFQRNAGSGALSFYKVYRNGDMSGAAPIRGLGGITALRLAPHRNHLYAVSELDSALVIFQRDPATGELTLQELLTDGIESVDGLLQPLSLVVDAQNHFLYSISTEQKIGQFEVSNGAPVAMDDNGVATVGLTGVIDVLMNDTDPDAGDTLRVVRVTTTSTLGAVNLINGQVQYTPAATGSASDSFTYTIADTRGAEAVATVTVSINTPPVAMDDTATTDVNTSVTIFVLANDYDPDGKFINTLSISQFESVSQMRGTVNPQNITRSMRAVASPSITALTYTPRADFSGVDTFTYSVSDNQGGTATGTVTVTVGKNVGITTLPSAGSSSSRKKGGGASDFASLAVLTLSLVASLRSRRNHCT